MIEYILIFVTLIVICALAATILRFMPNMESIKVRKFWLCLALLNLARAFIVVLSKTSLMGAREYLISNNILSILIYIFFIWFINDYYGRKLKE